LQVFLGVEPRSGRKGFAVLDVVSQGAGLSSLLVWLCCFLHMGATALMASWMSTFFQVMGGCRGMFSE
jgi:hypothetical protein